MAISSMQQPQRPRRALGGVVGLVSPPAVAAARRFRRASSESTSPAGASTTMSPIWRSSRSPELKIVEFVRCRDIMQSTATTELSRVR